MIGLLGVAIALLSIGLTFVALDDSQRITPIALVAFSVAGLFFLVFMIVWIYLWRCQVSIGKKIKCIGRHIRAGIEIRDKISELDKDSTDAT